MTTHVSLSEVQAAADELVSRQPNDAWDKFESIYGIPTGGHSAALAVASSLAYNRGIRLRIQGEPSMQQNLLIVDDVYDSGKTAEPYLRRGQTVAVLYARGTSLLPSYPSKLLYGRTFTTAQGYLVFPWEGSGDKPAAGPEDAVRRLLQFLGLDPDSPDVRETPRRVLKWLEEFKPEAHQEFAATAFEQIEYDGMVLVKRIPFVSMCEHHLLPFTGHAAVAYIPSKHVLGLSKLARIVHHYAKRPQVQERLTTQVNQAIQEATQSSDVGVVLQAEHMCMSLRGPQVPGHQTVTSSLTGAFMRKKTREEFLLLSGAGR